VERRLDLAAALRAAAPRPPPLVLLGAGTPHKPPPPCEITKRPLTEATAGARHLIKQGVPAAAILKETQSFDTVGNALFGLTTHAAPRGWGSLAVVTSAFHMARARALFGAVFGLASPAFRPGLSPYALAYYAASDDGVASAEALAARREREEASIATFEAATASLDSLAAFHAWVHATHLCYATARQDEFGAGAEGEAGPRRKSSSRRGVMGKSSLRAFRVMPSLAMTRMPAMPCCWARRVPRRAGMGGP
jgi:hypothetical protein